jgi:hypothetical protein
MRSSSQVYGPDDLKILSQIVTVILEEMMRGGCAVIDDELRQRVGKQVIRWAANDPLNIEGIKRAVTASLDH